MALVIIFVAMLVTSVGEPLKNGYIAPLDTIDPLNGGVLGEWVGRLGGAPVIVALVVIAVTSRKYGWRSFLGHAATVLVGVPLVLTACLIGISLALATPENVPFAKDSMGRTQFIGGLYNVCFKKSANAGLCDCVSKYVADRVTRAEIISGDMNRFRDVAQACGTR